MKEIYRKNFRDVGKVGMHNANERQRGNGALYIDISEAAVK